MTGNGKVVFLLFAAMLLQSCGGGSDSGSTGNQPSTPKDTTPPYVTSTNPSNSATGVPINTSITATFSEQLNSASPSSAFTLTQGTTVCSGTVSYTGSTATFTPTATLGSNLTYTATLSTAVKDVAGNAMATSHSWNFTTSDCSSTTFIKQFDLGSTVQGDGFECLATDGTSIYLYTQVYLASNGTLHQINPQTGAITSSTNIPMVAVASTAPGGINFIADITWHNNAIWASGSYVKSDGVVAQGVFKVNLTTGLAESAIPVAAGETNEVEILQGLASDGTNLYAAIDRDYQSPTAAAHVIVKLDPATSAQIPLSPALIITEGQVTRLDYGNGFLWVWVNPKFQKANPTSGAILATYCKDDGGANILYLNNAIWSIQGTIMRSYSLQ